MLMQRYELDAWLGDVHGLTADQMDRLLAAAHDIGRRYPDPDDTDERDAALTVAYRLLVEDPHAVMADLAAELTTTRTATRLARAAAKAATDNRLALVEAEQRAWSELTQARLAETRVLAAARQCVVTLVPPGAVSEAGFAREVGVDRMSVRGWLGKRRR